MEPPEYQADGDQSPPDEEIELVARHGSGPLEQALAIVMVARRRDRMDEIYQLIEGEEP